MSTRAVIFDMDGVIIDSEPHWVAVEQSFFAEHGGQYTPDLMARLMGSNAMYSAQTVKDTLGIDWPLDKIISDRIARLMKRYDTDLALMPGYTELMSDIVGTGAPRALASGSTTEIIQYVLSKFDIADHFAVALSCDEVGKHKPSPDVFLAAAERLGMKPEHCVVIEDSPNGVLAAKSAGMICVATPNKELTAHDAYKRADLIRPTLQDISLRDLGL